MTGNDATQPTGEERLRSRRRSFLRYSLVALAVAVTAGMTSGFLGASVAKGALPAWLVYVAGALFISSFAWFTHDYMRRIDELDRLDNLWSALFGFYFYFVTFPVWTSLATFNLAPAVDGWLLWIATTIVIFAAYCLRKLGLR